MSPNETPSQEESSDKSSFDFHRDNVHSTGGVLPNQHWAGHSTSAENHSETFRSPLSAVPVNTVRPTPVVRVLSPVGVEYVFLTIALFVGAGALTAALISLVNGKTDFNVLAFPAAALLITVPVFAVIFLHLKKLETDVPDLKLDASKRRSTQFTQIVSFIICLFTLIGFVYDIFSKMGGQGGPSYLKAALDSLCILLVFGGILFYYYRDEHVIRRN